ncbi:MAG: glycerophosphodiester phosphodiesterase [Patescibacteria group bacterium]
MKRPVVYAHRGASAICPENTMAAFRMALEMGAGGIETDVQMSRDGRLVLCHDEMLDRTTNGRGPLAARAWDELRALDAGAWFGEEFAGERLPLLEDLLELLAPSGARLNIEIKSGVVIYPGIEEAVVAEVRRHGMAERVILSSFNHYSLLACKRLAPEIATGVLYMEGLVDPWLYARRIEADALHPLHYGVRPELVAGAHAAGLLVNTWTVDDPGRIEVLSQAGVDGIITNTPDRALAALGTDA